MLQKGQERETASVRPALLCSGMSASFSLQQNWWQLQNKTTTNKKKQGSMWENVTFECRKKMCLPGNEDNCLFSLAPRERIFEHPKIKSEYIQMQFFFQNK